VSRIALFGTSADPPTLGHRALLQGLLAHFPQVATWASDNPMKPQQAPLEVRIALLEALVEAIANPRLELVQELSSPWAIDTLERARSRWPQATPVFVVGSDLVPQMPGWRQAAPLLAGLEVAVAPRQGWILEESDLERLRALGARVELLELPVPATASSRVRGAAGQPPDPAQVLAQVPEELWPLLRRHGLYGLPSISP
jgi:nicotinate-nucleotide adenylyltransferase